MTRFSQSRFIRNLSPRRSARSFRGLTLIEVAISVVIIGGMMVAALTTVGTASLGRRINADRQVGRLLAEQLMTEILSKSYVEPGQFGEGLLGREPSESGGIRTDWDDVDDYAGWSASPPEMEDGTPIPDRTGWGRAVQVDFVNLFNHNTVVTTSQGLKRIIVSVTHNGAEVASLTAAKGKSATGLWGS